nr:MAG TPA: hypothetical protein [Caudoviricetes sp.]
MLCLLIKLVTPCLAMGCYTFEKFFKFNSFFLSTKNYWKGELLCFTIIRIFLLTLFH